MFVCFLSPLSFPPNTPSMCPFFTPLCLVCCVVVYVSFISLSVPFFLSLCVHQFQDELTAQEQDGEGHEEEEEREEEAPALGTPTFNTPPDIP